MITLLSLKRLKDIASPRFFFKSLNTVLVYSTTNSNNW